MSSVRIGVIGCGGMARSHASRFEDVLDRIEVTAVVDIERDKARGVADLLGGDIVVPHHLHHPVTMDCLAAGKHVLVEKPMALTEAECVAMIEEAERCERVLMVAYCVRFHPLVVKMKELLDAGTYGDVFQLSIWTEQLTHREEGHWSNSTKLTELEMGHFIDCIETGGKPLADPVGSLEGLQVIWKLYEAEDRSEVADLRGLGLDTFRA